MRGVVRHMQEERFVPFAGLCREIYGVVGNGIRGVKFIPGIIPLGCRFG